MKIGIVGTGDMGSAIGRRLLDHGAEVVTCLAGRSERSRRLAEAAGIDDVGSLAEFVRQCDVVLSILVPAAAPALADALANAVRESDSAVTIVDANAVAPATAQQMARVLGDAGAIFVDGSIIGSPPEGERTPRLFLSGPSTAEVEALATHGMDVRRVSAEVGAASALKMSFGALTKGVTALATQLLVAAARNDVLDALIDELDQRQGPLLQVAERSIPPMPAKSRRWVGEMEEIADAFAAVGLPPGTYRGIAELYRWVGEHPLAQEHPETRDVSRSMAEVITLLARPSGEADDGA